MAIMRIIAGLMSVLAAFTVLPALAAPLTLSGEVTYRERIALPPNAVLSVQLLDLTDADGIVAICHAIKEEVVEAVPAGEGEPEVIKKEAADGEGAAEAK